MKKNRVNTVHMMLFYSKITINAWFQYKLDAILRSFSVFLREAGTIAVVYFTLITFNDINGWNIKELMFLFSFIFLTYSILIILFTGLRDFEWIVNDGRFDRFLLRPRGVLFQILASNSDWFAAIGHGGLGVLLFVLSANNVNVEWSTLNIIYFAFTIFGGVLIQGSIFLIIASLSFFFIKTGNIRDVFYWNIRSFAVYPISVFPKIIQVILIYIIPFAFVNYFPSQFFLLKSDMIAYPEIYIYITPIVGLTVYLLAYLFWRVSLKHYKSSGN